MSKMSTFSILENNKGKIFSFCHSDHVRQPTLLFPLLVVISYYSTAEILSSFSKPCTTRRLCCNGLKVHSPYFTLFCLLRTLFLFPPSYELSFILSCMLGLTPYSHMQTNLPFILLVSQIHFFSTFSRE